jgi:4a-hydroxytetrahydrobiopterin dehydratase|tara:strand:+ start:127 stop:417 length:291 start_codon:yes stop_codon:yes gene_type:complete
MIEITDELEKILKEELLNWSLSDDGIDRWISRDVSSNIGKIVNDIWDIAEDANHHPDIVAGYKGISVKLLTHDKNAITDKDIDLARKIENLILSLN